VSGCEHRPAPVHGSVHCARVPQVSGLFGGCFMCGKEGVGAGNACRETGAGPARHGSNAMDCNDHRGGCRARAGTFVYLAFMPRRSSRSPPSRANVRRRCSCSLVVPIRRRRPRMPATLVKVGESRARTCMEAEACPARGCAPRRHQAAQGWVPCFLWTRTPGRSLSTGRLSRQLVWRFGPGVHSDLAVSFGPGLAPSMSGQGGRMPETNLDNRTKMQPQPWASNLDSRPIPPRLSYCLFLRAYY